jgi:hypothetical protein
MKHLFTFALLFFTTTTFAANIDVQRRDMKLASQVLLEKQVITTPIVAAANTIKTTYAGPTSTAAVVLTSFTAQPDVARLINITPTGTTGDVEACVITIAGTNINGAAITDTITFVADASSAVASSKAFKTVTSVTWPANCESGSFAATWTIGITDALGLKRCMDAAGHVAFAVFNNAYEGTRPTCVADVDEVEKNTCDINGTLDGAKNVELYFIQNFRCLP